MPVPEILNLFEMLQILFRSLFSKIKKTESKIGKILDDLRDKWGVVMRMSLVSLEE